MSQHGVPGTTEALGVGLQVPNLIISGEVEGGSDPQTLAIFLVVFIIFFKTCSFAGPESQNTDFEAIWRPSSWVVLVPT